MFNTAQGNSHLGLLLSIHPLLSGLLAEESNTRANWNRRETRR
ncbi:hypothetical protein SAMCCGM7_pC0232 (plasmid) [Sinorhizobium americanum CCGM7]|nr:hypothetical protein SAMCCGM7_pC0232 [Sinorhizobium americanum CCGM7]